MEILLSVMFCAASALETSCQTYVFPMEDAATIEQCEEQSGDFLVDVTREINSSLARQGVFAYPVLFSCVVPGEEI